MKNFMLLVLLVLSATGCDTKGKPLIFTPVFASNSNIFGFDVLQGPIKSFTQRMTHQDGRLVASYMVKIDEDGCFTSINFNFSEIGVRGKYVKDGEYYINDKTKVKEYKLNGKCNIIEAVNSGSEYVHNEKGFLVSIKNVSTSKEIKNYEYDESGFPVMQLTQAATLESKYISDFSSEKKMPFNYKTQSYINKKLDSVISRYCKVDSHDNPILCAMVESNKDGSVNYFTATYVVEYF